MEDTRAAARSLDFFGFKTLCGGMGADCRSKYGLLATFMGRFLRAMCAIDDSTL
jgi:hypothetical protein